MTAPANVTMRLAARADNVALVREMLGGFGEAVGLGPVLEDVRAAASEACNNVVLHAYGGEEGPLEVELRLQRAELEVTVRDHGSGTVVRIESDDEPVARGIGLTVIEALSARSEITAQPDVGTEVRMWFELARPTEGWTPVAEGPAPGAGEVSVVMAPARLSAAILGRLLGALAARAGFSIDRLSDVQLVADALAARLPAALAGEHVIATFDTLARRTIAVSLDGLGPGGGRALLAGPVVAEIGPLIERLSDEVELSAGSGGETVRLVLRDRRDGR